MNEIGELLLKAKAYVFCEDFLALEDIPTHVKIHKLNYLDLSVSKEWDEKVFLIDEKGIVYFRASDTVGIRFLLANGDGLRCLKFYKKILLNKSDRFVYTNRYNLSKLLGYTDSSNCFKRDYDY